MTSSGVSISSSAKRENKSPTIIITTPLIAAKRIEVWTVSDISFILPEAKKRAASLRDLGIGAYLLNPLKDTYQADDIARDYLHMTLPSYQELFGKETLAAQLARIDEEETAKRLKSYFGYLSCIPLMAWAEMKKQLAAEGMLGLMAWAEMKKQ